MLTTVAEEKTDITRLNNLTGRNSRYSVHLNERDKTYIQKANAGKRNADTILVWLAYIVENFIFIRQSLLLRIHRSKEVGYLNISAH